MITRITVSGGTYVRVTTSNSITTRITVGSSTIVQTNRQFPYVLPFNLA